MSESSISASATDTRDRIPRSTIRLLLLMHLCIVAPLAGLLSPWLIALSLICVAWRLAIEAGRVGYPGRPGKALFVLAAVSMVVAIAPVPLSLDTAARLLAVTFALKLIEARHRSDMLVAVLLGYFVIASGFLFEQSPVFTGYQLLMLAGLTATLVALQPTADIQPMRAQLGMGLMLIAQALPLTLVVFILFPRVAPLWSVPVPGLSVTGLREQMTPGEVAELARSDALAFRAVFESEVPAQRDRYWRALVYSDFQAGTWAVGAEAAQGPASAASPPVDAADPFNPVGQRADQDQPARTFDYEIWLEPHASTWLPVLEQPLASAVFRDGMGGAPLAGRLGAGAPRRSFTPTALLRAEEPVLGVLRYALRSRVGADRQEPALTAQMRGINLRLPDQESPRLRAWAARIKAEFPMPQAFVERVLLNIRAERFHYTLNPPALPREHSIDTFWFETRRGFCTHYAGALVFILRSVGIPARLIGGFQGGELNPLTRHVVVRDYDAHAWVEYWVPGSGWTRVDPTTAVAPERIEQGPQAALSPEDRATISGLAGARLAGLVGLKPWINWMDSIDHRWNVWVVGYDTRAQNDLLSPWLGAVTPGRLALALTLAGVLAMLVAVAFPRVLRTRMTVRLDQARAIKTYLVFARRAGRLGWPPLAGETPAAHVQRVARGIDLNDRIAKTSIATLQRVLYAPAGDVQAA
ncbi:MAG: transglutaminaseTgpA domain-containing protein, partial [Gammaproteobacteria bacterium]